MKKSSLRCRREPDVEGVECFFWSEDGEIRFCFIADEGCPEEVPDEVVETLQRIDADYRNLYPSDGPAFLLAEHLTGIALTPELLEGSTYLCGVIPEPR